MSDRLEELRRHIERVGPLGPAEPTSFAAALARENRAPETIHELICAEFPFLRSAEALRLEQGNSAAALLAWVERELALWQSNSPASTQKLDYLLCATGLLGWTGDAWSLMTARLDQNADLLKGLGRVVSEADCAEFALHHWEARFGKSSREDLERWARTEDWQSLDGYMPPLLDLLHDSRVEQSVRALAKWDREGLADALDKSASVFTCVLALQTLLPADALTVGDLALSDRVKFWGSMLFRVERDGVI